MFVILKGFLPSAGREHFALKLFLFFADEKLPKTCLNQSFMKQKQIINAQNNVFGCKFSNLSEMESWKNKFWGSKRLFFLN